jgi:hypothetical protein
MVFPLAIGAVVDGSSRLFHTPDSGHFSPVLAVVPIGCFMFISLKPYAKFGVGLDVVEVFFFNLTA